MTEPEGAGVGGPERVVERSLARHRDQYVEEVQRLLDATLAVMHDQETSDPTVGDILARAELSTSAFYRHFPTKDDLLVVVLEEAHALTAAHVEERMATATEPVDRIEQWVRAVLDLARTEESLRRNRALLLAHPRLLQRFPQEISAGFAVLAWPLRSAIADARRQVGLPEGDAALDARLALSQVFSLMIDAAAVRTPPGPELVDATVAYTVRAAIGAPPPAEPSRPATRTSRARGSR